MVVPRLRGHLNGHQQTDDADDSCQSGSHLFTILQSLSYQLDDTCHTNATPDSVGIEGTGVGVVALTRL